MCRSLAVVQAEVTGLDADKGDAMKAHRKALRVAQISLPFNILGPDVSSQNKAVIRLVAAMKTCQKVHYCHPSVVIAPVSVIRLPMRPPMKTGAS